MEKHIVEIKIITRGPACSMTTDDECHWYLNQVIDMVGDISDVKPEIVVDVKRECEVSN